MQADGVTLTSNRSHTGGVYLCAYERSGALMAQVDLTPKQAKRLARNLKRYAKKAEAR